MSVDRRAAFREAQRRGRLALLRDHAARAEREVRRLQDEVAAGKDCWTDRVVRLPMARRAAKRAQAAYAAAREEEP